MKNKILFLIISILIRVIITTSICLIDNKKEVQVKNRYVSKVKWHNINNLLPKIFEKHRKNIRYMIKIKNHYKRLHKKKKMC